MFRAAKVDEDKNDVYDPYKYYELLVKHISLFISW